MPGQERKEDNTYMSEISKDSLTPPAAPAQEFFKMATVTALFGNGMPKITFDGESAPSEKQYTCLSGYRPVVNDRVLLAVISGTYVILGKVTNTAVAEYVFAGNVTINGNLVTTGSGKIGGNFGIRGANPTARSTSTLASNATLAQVIAKQNEVIGDLDAYGFY
jgi:hypothetical protein